MDTYDLASDARDEEINLILGDRDREKVQAIDEALGRIDDGSYGICESCEGGDRRGAAPGLAVHTTLRELPGGSRARAQDEPAVRGRPQLPALSSSDGEEDDS